MTKAVPISGHDPQRLSVALIITELAVGGAERCLVGLATGLDPDRYAPQVYSLAPPPPEERSDLVRRLRESGVPVHFVGTARPRQWPVALWRLRRMLRRQGPHLVQTFLYHANVTGALAARWAGVRAVVAGIRVAERGRRRWLAQRLAGDGVDRWVCVSEAVARHAQTAGRLPGPKLVVIPNGIDTAAYPVRAAADLSALGIPAGRRAIVQVGRLDEQKGVDWLLRLTPDLFARLPEHDLLLVGTGPALAALESLARSLGIAPRVHFAGWRTDVPEILRSCELLLLPSRWEGMPNVLLEAMASGLPVVATDVEGVAELLGTASDAQIAALGAASAFIDKVAAIVQDSRKSAELGRQNRQTIEERFTLRGMIERYERLYESLIAP